MQVLGFACDHERCPMMTVPANEHEAQRGLNDIFPGDPYPVGGVLQVMRQGAVQAIHAGISRRDWHATEVAANELRDKMDDLIRRTSPETTSIEKQLRNLLEAVREDNQRLRAELSEMRAQDSDLAERDEPLTPEDKALLDRAWEKHAAAKRP
jgi:hypothetical protein